MKNTITVAFASLLLAGVSTAALAQDDHRDSRDGQGRGGPHPNAGQAPAAAAAQVLPCRAAGRFNRSPRGGGPKGFGPGGPEGRGDRFQFPQREAAFFYGLFLRGHSADELRRDIRVPAAVLAKWDRESERQPELRSVLERVVQYRQHVLAIFENLLCHDSTTQRLQ